MLGRHLVVGHGWIMDCVLGIARCLHTRMTSYKDVDDKSYQIKGRHLFVGIGKSLLEQSWIEFERPPEGSKWKDYVKIQFV